MELCIFHDCTHVSSIQMAVTIPWNFIFMMMILLYWMVVPMPWIFSYKPYYLDGCIYIVDSCFSIKYVYVYASLIFRSPDSVCLRP